MQPEVARRPINCVDHTKTREEKQTSKQKQQQQQQQQQRQQIFKNKVDQKPDYF